MLLQIRFPEADSKTEICVQEAWSVSSGSTQYGQVQEAE